MNLAVVTFIRVPGERGVREIARFGTLYVRTADCPLLSARPMGRTSRKKGTKVLRCGSSTGISTYWSGSGLPFS